MKDINRLSDTTDESNTDALSVQTIVNVALPPSTLVAFAPGLAGFIEEAGSTEKSVSTLRLPSSDLTSEEISLTTKWMESVGNDPSKLQDGFDSKMLLTAAIKMHRAFLWFAMDDQAQQLWSIIQDRLFGKKRRSLVAINAVWESESNRAENNVQAHDTNNSIYLRLLANNIRKHAYSGAAEWRQDVRAYVERPENANLKSLIDMEDPEVERLEEQWRQSHTQKSSKPFAHLRQRETIRRDDRPPKESPEAYRLRQEIAAKNQYYLDQPKMTEEEWCEFKAKFSAYMSRYVNQRDSSWGTPIDQWRKDRERVDYWQELMKQEASKKLMEDSEKDSVPEDSEVHEESA